MDSREVSIYTSYAKDLFIELSKQLESKDSTDDETMQMAIDLIKQAKAEFEK